MEIFLSKKFERMFKKSPREIQNKFIERLKLFRESRYHALLNNHALSGALYGLRSINVSGDWRVIFEEKYGGVVFVDIGRHSQLYK